MQEIWQVIPAGREVRENLSDSEFPSARVPRSKDMAKCGEASLGVSESGGGDMDEVQISCRRRRNLFGLCLTARTTT